MSGQTGDDSAGGSAENEEVCKYCGGDGRCQKCYGVPSYHFDRICPACEGTGLCYCQLGPVKPAQ